MLVYPRASLEQRLFASNGNGRPDQLTIEYLKVFLKAQPQAQRLRAELVRQLVGIGQYADARQQLALLSAAGNPASRSEAAWLEYQIRYQETFAEPEKSPRRTQLAAALRQQLQAVLASPLSTEQLMILSQHALASGDRETAREIFARLLQNNTPMRDDAAVKLAGESLGLGDYPSSAAFYFRAMEVVPGLDMKRDYYMKGLRTLLSGGMYAETISAADRYIGPLSDDRATLIFLTHLAQSANEPAAAERYVKQLLKLSMLEHAHSAPAAFWSMRDFALALRAPEAEGTEGVRGAGGARIVRAAASASAPRIGEGPFDEEIYTLAYNVFLANSNLADARLLAQSAVRRQPDSADWRKRLAQVSEWSGAPLEATPQWLAYARLSGDEAGWDNVLRLSSGTFDQEILKEALEHKLQSDPGNVKWLDQLLAQYENIGTPQSAIDLLTARLRLPGNGNGNKLQRKAEMERLLGLYRRTGADGDALAVLRRLQREFGPNAQYALQIANQLYPQGRVEEAMAALAEAAPATPADNANFWRAYAEVARFMQDDGVAKSAYRGLLSSNVQNENDLSNLISLMAESQPLAAADLAEFGYAQKGGNQFALQALIFRSQVGDWEGAQRFLDRVPAAQQRQLAQNAGFLAARAVLKQARRDVHGAAADLRAALILQPDNMGLRANLIWILIAARDTAPLQKILRLWAQDAETNPALWGPFAAADMSINRQPEALHWFRKSGFPRDDYLWLMSYAECLDANGQPDLAWRIRRRAWFDLRKPEVLRKMDPAQLRDIRDRLAALAPLFMPADGADRVLQALLRADVEKLPEPPPAVAMPADGAALLKMIDAEGEAGSGKTGSGKTGGDPAIADADGLFRPGADAGRRPRDDARMSASVRELALGVALNRNAPDLAQAWLATRYARQLDKPLWGELSLMLANGDSQDLNRLLDDLPDWLPMYDRIDAARLAGRVPLAQTLAFDQLAILPRDEDLHQRLVGLSTEDPAAFSAAYARRSDAPLSSQKFEVSTGFKLSPGTALFVGLSDRLQRSTDTAQLDNVPGHDRKIELTLRRRTDTGFISIAALHRQAMESINGARIDFSSARSDKLTLSGNAGFRQEATDSVLMMLGAMRSGGEINANYLLSRTEYTRLGLGWQQYSTQAGTSLGSGRTWNAEAGTHFRVEYPNLTLRAYASDAAFSDKGAVDAQIARLTPAGADPATFRFMPVDSRVYGLSLGAGTVAETAYTRAWRPFAEIGVTYTPGLGWGRDMRAGAAGSVAGQDVLSVVFQSIGATANAQKTLELGVNYKWFY